jgi:hypothetical protein
VAIASSTPSAERRQHGRLVPPEINERAFRPFWRASDRIEKLHLRGAISAREMRAAAEFRRLYERAYAGPGGLRAADLSAVRQAKHCGKPVPTMTEGQVEALGRLRRIRQALSSLYDLLELALITEFPLAYGIAHGDPCVCRSCRWQTVRRWGLQTDCLRRRRRAAARSADSSPAASAMRAWSRS